MRRQHSIYWHMVGIMLTMLATTVFTGLSVVYGWPFPAFVLVAVFALWAAVENAIDDGR